MAKKRRLRKTGYFDAPEAEDFKQEVKEELKKEVESQPPPPPEPQKEPKAPKKSLTNWLKGSPKEE